MKSLFWQSETSAVDAKGRINVPAKLRRGLAPEAADTFMLIHHEDGCLRLYPLDQWRVYTATLRKMGLGNEDARRYLRDISSTAHEATIDGQGRILVSRTLLDLAGVDGQAKLVGMNQWIELWEPGRCGEASRNSPEAKKRIADDIDTNMALQLEE
jgi:MraZ protein